jgi:hypothetical protein
MAGERKRGDPSEAVLENRRKVIEQNERFFEELKKDPVEYAKYLKAKEKLDDSRRSGDINPHPGRIIRG